MPWPLLSRNQVSEPCNPRSEQQKTSSYRKGGKGKIPAEKFPFGHWISAPLWKHARELFAVPCCLKSTDHTYSPDAVLQGGQRVASEPIARDPGIQGRIGPCPSSQSVKKSVKSTS